MQSVDQLLDIYDAGAEDGGYVHIAERAFLQENRHGNIAVFAGIVNNLLAITHLHGVERLVVEERAKLGGNCLVRDAQLLTQEGQKLHTAGPCSEFGRRA